MKKKKIINLLSCFFGLVAICGFFGISVIGNRKGNIETKAEDYLIQKLSNNNINLNFLSDRVVDGERVINENTNVLRLNYDVSLYENRDLAYKRYKLLYNANISLDSGIEQIPQTSLYQNGSTSLIFSSDYLLDISSFNLKIYLEYFDIRIGEKYSDYHQSNVVYLYYEIAMSVVNVTTNAFESNLFIQGDFGNTFGVYPYSTSQEKLIASLNAALAAGNLGFNNDLSITPLRSHLFINQFYFDAMATDFDIGFNTGYNQGYDNGYVDGLSAGINQGYNQGYQAGVDSQQYNITSAYNDGYNVGFSDASQKNQTALTIFSGILQIGMLPINMFLAMFNFEILGINMASFVSALLTVCITIIVVKTVMGSTSGGDSK